MEKYKLFFKKHYNQNNVEEILFNLRELGATQMQTVIILCSEANMSLADANMIVQNSITWQDRKKENDDFSQKFGEFLNES